MFTKQWYENSYIPLWVCVEYYNANVKYINSYGDSDKLCDYLDELWLLHMTFRDINLMNVIPGDEYV